MRSTPLGSKSFFWPALLLLLLGLAGCAPAQLAPPPITPTALAQPEPSATVTRSSVYFQLVEKPGVTPSPSPLPTRVPPPTLSPTPPLLPFDLTKGPTLIYTGRPGEMRIFWQWIASADFRVDWGVDENYALGSARVAEYDLQNHLYAFTISGLQPAALYRYRVVLDQNASLGSFRSAPAASETRLKFVSYGDTRTYPDLHDAVARQVIDLYQADPLYQTVNLMVGDFVNYGDDDATWTDELFSPAYPNIRALMANVAWLPVMGNHEGSGELYARYFPLPFTASRYTSFDYGPAHIILLDQYVDYGPGSPQYEWLKADLSLSTKTWKIVVLHEPGWSAGGGHDNSAQVQNDLQPLFEQTGVALVLGGHNHYYARAEVNGITHLTVGTGGAPLYTPIKEMPNILAVYQGTGFVRFQIDGSELFGQFIAADGQEKDSFRIKR